MSNPIVTVNVSQTIAPLPASLQKTGALISQGGTVLSPGTYAPITQPADLTPLLAAPMALTTVVWASSYGGQVTATTTAVHGLAVNTQFVTTIAGVVPVAFNGTYLCMVTGASTFTYYLPGTTPGAQSVAGTYTPRNAAELMAMATTFFAQGAQQSVFVLELGAGEPAAGVTALAAFINASPQFFYSYLVPRTWDGNSTFLTFLNNFNSTTAKTYFFVTTSLQNWHIYTALQKCVVTLIEAPIYGQWAANVLSAASWTGGLITATTTTNHGVAPGQYFTIAGCTPAGYNGTFLALPGTTGDSLVYAAADPGANSVLGTLLARTFASAGVPTTEFSHASDFWVSLNYNPSTTNKVTPFAFSFLFGVTPFPTQGNSALLSTLKAANINLVGTGAEGGISDTILLWGHTMDGRPFNYWYSVDWMQINVALAIANEIINGSNNPANPLDYDQNGINRLQDRAAATGSSAITFGLAIGTPKKTALDGTAFQAALNADQFAGQLEVNAVPFTAYSVANPSDFRIGKYSGLSMVYTPARGFEQIIFNINVTDFVA